MKCMSYFLHMLLLKNVYGFLRFYRLYKKCVSKSPFAILCEVKIGRFGSRSRTEFTFRLVFINQTFPRQTITHGGKRVKVCFIKKLCRFKSFKYCLPST